MFLVASVMENCRQAALVSWLEVDWDIQQISYLYQRGQRLWSDTSNRPSRDPSVLDISSRVRTTLTFEYLSDRQPMCAANGRSLTFALVGLLHPK